MWATVKVRLCVSNFSPGRRHGLPHTSHTQLARCFTPNAMDSQSGGYRLRSIGMFEAPEKMD
jgi:hypothetical protein